MKNDLVKKILPHIIAILVFLVVALIFCKPALEGMELTQHDIINWKGMAQNAFEYKEKHGHFPLWNTNLYGGMPNYQIAMEGKSVLPDLTSWLSLGLPKPINFFFLASLFFYILCLILNIRPVVAILASLGYAFSTYNPVVINAGHDTQMLATAYMPLLLGGLIAIYEKKYWLGLAITVFATCQQVGMNHLQISYYFLLTAALVTLGYAYGWIKNKEWKHMGIVAGITALSVVIGLAGNALPLMTTAEYVKYTPRGGNDVAIEGDSVKTVQIKGLDTAYAFEYSLSKPEITTLIMPNAFGGHSRTTVDENSHVVEKLIAAGVPESQAANTGLPKYWGALPYTAGPAYLGVLICILGVIGFVLVKSPLRWGLLAATILGIFIAWGKNFMGFNLFLFEHLPMFNKFRAPSMAQVIPQLTVGVMAALALQYLLFRNNAQELLKKDFKKVLYAVGGLFALLGLMYLLMDYTAYYDSALAANIKQQSQNDDISRAVINGLKEDRRAMFGGQLLRAAGFALLLLGGLYLYTRNMIKPLALAIGLVAISTIELALVSHDYLNDENYVPADDISMHFTPQPVDQQLLNDKDPDFRIFNNAPAVYPEAQASYYHKSITGYHPAKLTLAENLARKYLNGIPNPGILNMLNAKYFIVMDPQSRTAHAVPNPDAYGACWLVKQVKVADNATAALQAIGSTNLKDTAIVEGTAAASITQPQWDSTASIRLVKFDNDQIDYESNAAAPQFAVFSEMYYPAGWNAYIDGKPATYFKTDYALRGIQVPAGKHAIRFVFEPSTFRKGVNISFAASFAVLIALVGGLFMAWKQGNKKTAK